MIAWSTRPSSIAQWVERVGRSDPANLSQMTSPCPLCSGRKAKRACPALERQICPVCCGTKRLTEIRCTPDCAYLAASKAHPPAVVQRRQERDVGFLLRFLANLTESQQTLLLLFVGATVRHATAALPAPNDADIAEAAASVASTLETARKGIIYRHQPASLPAQRLAETFETELARIGEGHESTAARLERDASNALRQLSEAAAAAAKSFGSEDPAVFLAFAKRFTTKLSEEASGPRRDGDREAEAPARLVIPG